MAKRKVGTKMTITNQEKEFENLIYEIRGQKVMLDSDLAKIYGVSTKRLNEQVKRNQDRFPDDFMFQLTPDEFQDLRSNRSQIATGSLKHRDPKSPPYAFTGHGTIMVANVLNSTEAVQMSVFVIRAFVRMRAVLTDSTVLAKKLTALEKELTDRLDVHEAAIVTILQRVMEIIDPPPLPVRKRKKIGFRKDDK